jgi:hypothetical protein
LRRSTERQMQAIVGLRCVDEFAGRGRFVALRG